MLSLKTTASMRLAVEACPYPELKQLLALRIAQLSEGDSAVELGDLMHIIIVEAGDLLCCVSAEAGFNPLECFIDGSVYGDSDFMPSWEWIEVHEGWVELAYILDDEGFTVVFFIERSAGTDQALLACCYEYGRDTEAF
jgi:hypothetical protein